MYSTCLFCSSNLGRNEGIEHFPVGKRLAYDEAKGRLWVICPTCQRWNLSPLESRWEAIEEAEREFRSTRVRMSTENVSLARMRHGLELVRIGAPQNVELASWRYGEQLRKRRRKYYAALGVGLGVTGLHLATTLGGLVGLSLIGTGTLLTKNAFDLRRHWRDRNILTVFLRDHDNRVIGLTKSEAVVSEVVSKGYGEWQMTLRFAPTDPSTGKLIKPPKGERLQVEVLTLEGALAHRALASTIPHANAAGGSARRINDALAAIESAPNLERLIFGATRKHKTIALIPETHRLALEMVSHGDDERRAMEGEMADLEARWRDAEEIASIADSLLVPASMQARFDALRRTRSG